jgi:hypothetical protein
MANRRDTGRGSDTPTGPKAQVYFHWSCPRSNHLIAILEELDPTGLEEGEVAVGVGVVAMIQQENEELQRNL